MMSLLNGWARRNRAGLVAIVFVLVMFHLSRLPPESAARTRSIADSFRFAALSVAMPAGYPQQTVRRVNKDYKNIEAWISSVGAGVAMNDLDGDGLANDLCISDPRTDRVAVTPAPSAASAGRYQPFMLDTAGLPMDRIMAPMGCVPGDFNEDGRIDLAVYYWGRTPILFLAREDAAGLSAGAYRPVELVPPKAGGGYRGPRWNSNAFVVADFDGDGHDDIFVGNYFPDGPVLDDRVSGGVTMQDSMSRAYNGGGDHILRWTGATSGAAPGVRYAEAAGAFGDVPSRGWPLAAGATDLDGDLRPELYVANDFGPDRLRHNRSTPGKIRLIAVNGKRTAMTPKSKVLGRDSFKGMGVDFGDLDGDGRYDIFVSNITTSYALQESQFAFVDTTRNQADLRRRLQDGTAPFADRSVPLGLAWSGWGWDAKTADFDNDGVLEVVQTTGFVKGKVNRWAQLQELATANDALVASPYWWPHVREGDDIAGDQAPAFFAQGEDGRYSNISDELGMAIPIPTRGVATGDADGDGRLDLAIARQWDEPLFYRNDGPASGASLALRLIHPPGPGKKAATGAEGDALPAPGSPVVGAQVTVKTGGRTLRGRVDGASGHGGKRSHEVFIGLGDEHGPVTAHLAWRDRTGQVREQDLTLAPGQHVLQLGAHAQEVTS
ncbi:CRTAC1 family protein [Actinomadura livida]|uniref:CRTAC1 family protein n=2 Tax=Actinomadura livida TaxID=79909 RepID=A0ABN1EFZ4_9ACTN|nr:RNA-binding protein [Actinomadura livida]